MKIQIYATLHRITQHKHYKRKFKYTQVRIFDTKNPFVFEYRLLYLKELETPTSPLCLHFVFMIYCLRCHSLDLAWKGGVSLEIIVSFLVSVMASVTAYFICKWFDRNDNGNEPKE